jgi:general secretion pathway protein B
MSYILEALRRAESERGRKRGVPGLHAQPVPSASADETIERRGKAWLWVVIGLTAGVLLPLLWRWWANDPAAQEAAARAPIAGSVLAQPSAGPTEAANAAALPAASAPTAPTAAAAAPPLPDATQTTHATAKPAATVKASGPSKPHVPAHTPALSTMPPVANPVGGAPAVAGRPQPSSPAQALPTPVPEPRLRTLAELPDEMRRSVPALAFGGSVYSEIATQRMVIFNGQVLREGDSLSDELLLEQIRPHSVVLRMRGQRFEVAF